MTKKSFSMVLTKEEYKELKGYLLLMGFTFEPSQIEDKVYISLSLDNEEAKTLTEYLEMN